MDQVKQIAGATIRMGEMRVDADGNALRTLLGSCIGVALHDRQQAIGGLAHVVLPDSRGKQDTPGKFADTAIPLLVSEIEKLGDRPLKLTAVLAGGASMFARKTATAGIGRLNVQACELALEELGISIAVRHCGGEKGRRMTFHPANGKVVIEIAGQDPIQIQ